MEMEERKTSGLERYPMIYWDFLISQPNHKNKIDALLDTYDDRCSQSLNQEIQYRGFDKEINEQLKDIYIHIYIHIYIYCKQLYDQYLHIEKLY